MNYFYQHSLGRFAGDILAIYIWVETICTVHSMFAVGEL